MFTILLVDDEKIDRDGIRFLINKFGLGLKVLEASSGQAALEILMEKKVNILLTDIKMPMMSGLELVEKAILINPNLKIIIFSAFREFDYAQQAMRMGVRHYLLKPIKVNDFKKLMQEVIQESLLKEHDEWKRKVTSILLSGSINEGMLQAPESNWPFGLSTVLIDFTGPILDQQGLDIENVLHKEINKDVFSVIINEYQILLFLKLSYHESKDACEKLSDTLQKMGHSGVIVLGGELTGLEQLPDVYQKMEHLAEYKFFYKGCIVMTVWEDDVAVQNRNDDFLQRAISIGNMIRNDEPMAMMETVSFLSYLEEKGNNSVIYTKYICGEMVREALKLKEDKEGQLRSWIERVYRSQQFEELKELCIELAGKNKLPSQGDTTEVNRKAIEDVISIIHKEYMKNINLEAVADRVYLSPSYLCSLFKKYTGQSFIKYLTAYRIEKSKELLRNSNLKIGTICEMIGYSSMSYYCSIFKNYYGVTPAQYRENKL